MRSKFKISGIDLKSDTMASLNDRIIVSILSGFIILNILRTLRYVRLYSLKAIPKMLTSTMMKSRMHQPSLK